MARGLRWFLLSLSVLIGCGGSRPASRPVSFTEAEPVETVAPVDKLVTRLVAARGLAPKRKIRVEHLGRGAFVRRLVGDSAVRESGLTAEAAFLLGFNFMPPPEARGEIVPWRQLLEDEVAGFYDVEADLVVVPDEARMTRRERENARGVLIHELQHAIQAQHFARNTSITSYDAVLAQRALYEGDATAAMAATLGLEADEPVQRTLRRLGDFTRRYRADSFHADGKEPTQGRALPLARVALDFPYEDGVLFVGDLYRAGGFDLVSRAFSRPPTTTEQVLHPQKYLDGEQPRTFTELELPPGHHELEKGSLGELRTRAFFRQCYDAAFADAVAAGWGGDAFRISVGPDRGIAVTWVSAWDSEEDAIELEDAVRTAAGCFAKNRFGDGGDDYAVSDRVAVLRVRDVVAVVRGGPPSADLGLHKLVASASPPVAPITFARLQVSPRPTLPEHRPGRVRGRRYESVWLGMSGTVPKTWNVTSADDAELVAHARDDGAVGIVFVSKAIATGDALDRTFARTIRDMERELSQTFHRDGRRQRRTLPLGEGFEERFTSDAGTSIHVVLVPICNATGAVGFVVGAPTDRSVPLTRKLLAAFTFDAGRNIPACAYLDPK